MTSGPIDFVQRLFGKRKATVGGEPPRPAGLQLPPGAEKLHFHRDDSSDQPLGFVTFQDHALGNGDYFGFYWPIGREDAEPIIAEDQHDGGTLEPGFSNLASFLRLTAGHDEGDWIELPTVEEDPASPLNRYRKARDLIAAGAFAEAVAELDAAIATLPEYTDALAALAGQHMRAGRLDDACRVAHQMIISPPCFGHWRSVQHVARWFSKLETGPADLADDPIWLGREKLATIPTGGTKDGPAYPVLREAIDIYVGRGDIVKALTLMQTYSDFMNGETKSFQERNGYDFGAHRARQRELSHHLPHGPRYLV